MSAVLFLFCFPAAVPPAIAAAGHVTAIVAQAEPAARAEPASQSGVTTTSTRSFLLDTFVVLVLFGGALFAVCRSSHRT